MSTTIALVAVLALPLGSQAVCAQKNDPSTYTQTSPQWSILVSPGTSESSTPLEYTAPDGQKAYFKQITFRNQNGKNISVMIPDGNTEHKILVNDKLNMAFIGDQTDNATAEFFIIDLAQGKTYAIDTKKLYVEMEKNEADISRSIPRYALTQVTLKNTTACATIIRRYTPKGGSQKEEATFHAQIGLEIPKDISCEPTAFKPVHSGPEVQILHSSQLQMDPVPAL